jgi:hypothetical protein
MLHVQGAGDTCRRAAEGHHEPGAEVLALVAPGGGDGGSQVRHVVSSAPLGRIGPQPSGECRTPDHAGAQDRDGLGSRHAHLAATRSTIAVAFADCVACRVIGHWT